MQIFVRAQKIPKNRKFLRFFQNFRKTPDFRKNPDFRRKSRKTPKIPKIPKKGPGGPPGGQKNTPLGPFFSIFRKNRGFPEKWHFRRNSGPRQIFCRQKILHDRQDRAKVFCDAAESADAETSRPCCHCVFDTSVMLLCSITLPPFRVFCVCRKLLQGNSTGVERKTPVFYFSRRAVAVMSNSIPSLMRRRLS